MQQNWLVVLPPIGVIILAAVTRRMLGSIIVGTMLAAYIATQGVVGDAVRLLVDRLWSVTEVGLLGSFETLWQANYLFVLLFLIFLGVIVEMITFSGAARAYGAFIQRRLASAQNVELATLVLSHLFFIDDYFNSLTVGSVMRSITDQARIPRARLALLINTVAAPLAIMVPVSSWAAEVVSQLRQAGVSMVGLQGVTVAADPFALFLSAIPFIFYAFIQVGSIWFFAYRQISFGILRDHQREAVEHNNLFGGKRPLIQSIASGHAGIGKPMLFDFVLPLIILLSCIGVGVFHYGYGKMPLILALGSFVAMTCGIGYFLCRQLLVVADVQGILSRGIMSMLPSVVVLIFLWTFCSLLKHDLATGVYLADCLLGTMNGAYLPAMFFCVGSVISTMMGSAWGAIGILLSIALPMLASLSPDHAIMTVSSMPVMLPLIGAVLSGALVANHMSPIADIILMSSASAGAYHIDLLKAQIAYAMPGFVVTVIGFIVAGRLVAVMDPLLLSVSIIIGGTILNCGVLQLLHWMDRRR